MKRFFILMFTILSGSLVFSQTKTSNILNDEAIAKQHYGNDHKWYEKNITFFECSDKTLEEVYYYR